MEVPQIKISQTVIVGIAIGAAILAIVLFYENQSMRRDLISSHTPNRKPCGCDDASINDVVRASAEMSYGPSISVTGERLNSAPMPEQSMDDPNHPPEVVI